MYSTIWWRQAGIKGLKESTVEPGKRLYVAGRMREDERRKTREGEGAHYVSVISRIHECFQFAQRRRLYAPVRFRCVGASACQKRRCKRKGGRKKKRKSREMEESGKKRRGKRRREERDSCEEEKLGASARAIYARITRVKRVGPKTPREKQGKRAREGERETRTFLRQGLKRRDVFLQLGFRKDSSCEVYRTLRSACLT